MGRRRFLVLSVVVATLAMVVAVVAIVVGGSGATVAAPSPDIGVAVDRAVPAAIADLPFTDQQGATVTLADERGKVVLLAPFLTSCQEECPITTAALLAMQRDLEADGLTGQVQIVEVTVDPGRDTPARMAAYAKLTGSSWPLLTASSSALQTFWGHFGIWYQRVAEGSPPGTDWQTGRPYTYDVNHSDGFVLIDRRGHERFVAGGMARIDQVPRSVSKLLDQTGRQNLADPGGGAWTVADALGGVGLAPRPPGGPVLSGHRRPDRRRSEAVSRSGGGARSGPSRPAGCGWR